MNTPISIMKTVSVCLLGMLAAAPLAQAEVDPSVIEFAKAQTEVKKIDLRGKKVSEAERTKNASRKGRWLNGSAKFTSYAQIKRDDPNNRILCSQEMTYNKKVIFEGASKSQTQLVYIQEDSAEKVIEAKEVDAIDETTGGVYVLFTPNVIYVLNYDYVDPSTGEKEPNFRKFENRN